ncbi:flagellar biosynthesis protein FlhF [Dyella lutea]|uniref:Flagellar biosynthesis protein FlhF n=1 Tax=Dyella lutea TaxID=2950441 RepID=A0ABT1F9V7_9GAMM|nr:flagellar biosynthesis protein FlhF [Dyella lutea]MCP1374161.1 flagellar biosynthesis protein FlhF [Dyella lutea]
MKIKRFVAADMRQAMRLVREEQGPDAVILSTRRLPEGIEIIAALDYDEALVREAARHGAPAAGDVAPTPEVKAPTPAEHVPAARHGRLGRRLLQDTPEPTTEATPAAAAAPADRLQPASRPVAPARPYGEDLAEDTVALSSPTVRRAPVPPAAPTSNASNAPARIAMPVARRSAAPVAAEAAPAPKPAAAIPSAPAPVPAPAPAEAKVAANEAPTVHPAIERAMQDTARMRAELGFLREMLEMQLSSLAWNDMERRHPLRARVLRELTRLGIDADVARKLADDLPEQISAEQARYLPLGMLSRSVAISGRGDSDGGMTALVGPTGVGKTTTIAKLAARAVVRHGAANVALVSTDHYRIGAAAQLEHYGRLMGVRVYPADDAASLRQVLEMLKGKHTVLIDTAGVSGTDPRLEQQMDVLNEVAHSDGIALRISLVLAANSQSQSLEESVRAYMPLEPASVVLTKLDEAPNLGGALSVLIRHRLPLDYTTDGQRVPEDLAVADARVLVLRAAHALKTAAPPLDDGMLAERFGFQAAHA